MDAKRVESTKSSKKIKQIAVSGTEAFDVIYALTEEGEIYSLAPGIGEEKWHKMPGISDV